RPENPGPDIKLPLRPQNIDRLRPRIRYDFSLNRPKGGQLIMSLSTTIYYAWVDTANQPFSIRASERKLPFTNFLYTITPSLRWGTVLTPFKAGIAYCWIVQSVLGLPAWPQYIHAEIFEEYHGLAGTLEIENSPQAAATTTPAGPDKEGKEFQKTLFANETYNSMTQSSHSPDSLGPALAVSNIFESRWFTCMFSTLLYIIAKATSGSVTDVLPPPRGPDPLIYHFRCAPGLSNKDQVDIYIFPSARQSQYPLTWDALAKTLLIFGTRVAQDEDGWESVQLVVLTV
ncbi:MAG: hypothetical protein Q9188_007680, partial [Gyalolechia gomerana]